jgi:hypothetical protein
MSPVTIIRGSDEDLPSSPIETVGFAAAIRGREKEFPYLARAVKNIEPADRPMISWADGRGKNFCQINRNPFGVTHAGLVTRLYSGRDTWEDARAAALTEHLQSVEQTIEHGVPERRIELYLELDEDGEWYVAERVRQFAGGFRHYLKRDLRRGDTIRLRPLQDLTFLDNRQEPDMDVREAEWLSEFSLEVTPH